MAKIKAAPPLMQTLGLVAHVLSKHVTASADELQSDLARCVVTWASERKPNGLPKLACDLERWTTYWAKLGPTVRGPLTQDGIADSVARLRAEGAAGGTILAYLTSVSWMITSVGLMNPGLRAGIRQIRRGYTPRASRRPERFRVPTLHADVTRLVTGANDRVARDVRNIVMVLIIYEGMTQFTELVGLDLNVGLSAGVQYDDLSFEVRGTSILHLAPAKQGASRRTIRLSADATAWLRHWVDLRGDAPGHLFSYGKADPRGPQVTKTCDSLPLWSGPKQFQQLAFRHRTSGHDLSAASLRLGRAVGLLDAGWSLSRVAAAGGWSAAALARFLDRGLSVLPKESRPREPFHVRWPLPRSAMAQPSAPEQYCLSLVDAA